MDLPVILAPDPVTVPAIAEKVYDRLHIKRVLIDISDPNKDGTAIAYVRHGRKDPDTGVWELAPDENDIPLRVDDIFARAAAGDVELAQAMGAIIAFVEKVAEEQLTPPPVTTTTTPPPDDTTTTTTPPP